ncbi:MAG TPA: bifunctional adenosylcobinamide kinase/adenosylcobinamide-phosphate guanylyltransferase [Metabacillus sp.]|nr:bifunctional adenosylcobinamide kinase/adenosylcobinamide-phosphate guanylyltransferase [Metabacillus sp.]
MIVFISGGARSGKSHFAEQTALSFAKKNNGNLYYLATAKKSDDEMVERIQIHQQDRGKTWITIEEPYYLEEHLMTCEKDDVVLIDCLTIWLSNVMFEMNDRITKLEEMVREWIRLARKKQFSLVIVSNEVNGRSPFLDEAVFTYMYTLQKLHQLIVEQSELAVEVQAGIPTYWKGEEE